MNSNIVKNNVSSYDIQKLAGIFCPSKIYTGDILSGKSIGMKKYLRLTSTTLSNDTMSVNTDEDTYIIDYEMSGYTNNLDVTNGDEIFVDNKDGKVYFIKNIHYIDMSDANMKFYITKIYDTHSVFECTTAPIGVIKANGDTNLYCTHLDTLSSQTSGNNSCVVGINISGYIYLKFNAEDERYFVNGKRIETVNELKSWISANSPRIYFERKDPITTDITDTELGQMLLTLNPKKEFVWEMTNLKGELSVYEDIDSALNDIRALILE